MIEFQNVSMAYKDRPVLNHVDLTIQDSEFFALIGSSGCGKTTLLKSINKLLNVQKGKLLINGTPRRILPAYFVVMVPYTLFLILRGQAPLSALVWNSTLLAYWVHTPGAFNWYVSAAYAASPGRCR